MNFKGTRINNLFLYWLIISFFLVFLIIIVGGLTRLTNSGLSIIEWELFKGILPPMNDSSWSLYFQKYQTIPQYKLINSNMSLNEFKIIFYWEYFHRFLARVIGLFFIIPLIFFYFSKKINRNHLNICYLILSLIIFQGTVGWYMVKSGLVNDVTVSHYRLSLHLIIAIIIISIIFWLILNVHKNKSKSFFNFSKDLLPFQIFIVLILLQIIIGAFVSGLDAGKVYQTWPLMGETYLPNDIIVKSIDQLINFNNHSLVQFYHRNLAYFIILYAFLLSIKVYKERIEKIYPSLGILIIVLILQTILGISTLISGLNIYLASAHQTIGVLLVLSAVNLYYSKTK